MENKNYMVKMQQVPEKQISKNLSFKQLLDLVSVSDPVETNGVKIYRGFTFRYAEDILDLVPDHFWMVSEWCYDTFRVVWISKKHLSIFIYCEGDLVLEICENMEVFNENIKKAAEFYKGH